jgi:hypothetical protein
MIGADRATIAAGQANKIKTLLYWFNPNLLNVARRAWSAAMLF